MFLLWAFLPALWRMALISRMMFIGTSVHQNYCMYSARNRSFRIYLCFPFVSEIQGKTSVITALLRSHHNSAVIITCFKCFLPPVQSFSVPLRCPPSGKWSFNDPALAAFTKSSGKSRGERVEQRVRKCSFLLIQTVGEVEE